MGFIGGLRLLVAMDVQGGKRHAACPMAPQLWKWVDALPPACRLTSDPRRHWFRLICNWWNVFVRIAEPTEHKEAFTLRPERIHLIATLVTHAGKKVFRFFCSRHEKSHDVKRAFTRLHTVFSRIESIAVQLDRPRVWAHSYQAKGIVSAASAVF